VGHSGRHRVKAASGGMATWTLEELLRTGKIDAAVCVTASQKGDRFFEPAIVRNTSALESCSGTKYYPVEYSEAVAHILSHEGRYAVIALPCVVTALRKAQQALPVLRERIRYVFALACGHGVSKRFTKFLLSLVGLDESKTQDIDFRYTAGSKKASNYAFRARGANGKWSRPLLQSGLLGRLWGGRFFVPTACEFCPDLFSPLADATFMDAWLPQYDDPRGTSIVVVRQAGLAELMEQGDCHLRSIAIEDVLRSQAAALSYKTVLLPLRVARAERDGLRIPRSFERTPAPDGLREKLAKTKLLGRRQLCERAFDRDGRARGFWLFVLTALLRGQVAWRAIRRHVRRFHKRIAGS
jgi:coenzyme F420 hydrogenase subunit beta